MQKNLIFRISRSFIGHTLKTYMVLFMNYTILNSLRKLVMFGLYQTFARLPGLQSQMPFAYLFFSIKCSKWILKLQVTPSGSLILEIQLYFIFYILSVQKLTVCDNDCEKIESDWVVNSERWPGSLMGQAAPSLTSVHVILTHVSAKL